LTALGFRSSAAVIFVTAMMVGMLLARWLANRPSLSRIATYPGTNNSRGG
jgi:hypothetical protein